MSQDSYADASGQQPGMPIAIIGIGCIFPKARNLQEYWTNLKEGIDAITDIPKTHWNPDEYFHEDPKTPDRTYAKKGGFLPEIDFDPLSFGILPNALEATDTSQLLSLVAAQDALRDAGYLDRQFDRDRTSVILGITGTQELVIPLGARLSYPLWRKALQDAGLDDELTQEVVERISQGYADWQESSFPGLLGNVVAGRIANRFDLGGTNCVVDAACASSLSAIHLAMMELQHGKADMVLTGGVDTFNHIFMYVCFSKTPALSPSGHARPFDRNSDGTTLGEGIGIIALKRLKDAERDGNKIYAVLKGVGSSSDGGGTSIYAPTRDGQKKAYKNAYESSGVAPETIELLEAHGTGTAIGDAMEIQGLIDAYGPAQTNGSWCALGSVKSQIGHTKAAAGAAGIIKSAMALYHKVLPPTIKVDQPAAPLDPGKTPFYVNTQKRPWLSPQKHPRRAAVSSFGFGGSNFHCVLEEYAPHKEQIDWTGNTQIFAWSSETLAGLQSALNSIDSTASWEALRREAARLRRHFDPRQRHRLLIVVERDQRSVETLCTHAQMMLDKNTGKRSWNTPDGIFYGQGDRPGQLAIIFPGQGSQYVDMLKDISCQFPQFQDVLDDANRIFHCRDETRRLSDLIYPHPSFSEAEAQAKADVLRSTQVAQPAIGAVSLALLKVLEFFGVEADALAGHSFGELVALCASKVLDRDTFFAMSKLRGRLMAQREGDSGSMLAVQGDLLLVEKVVEEEHIDLVIANKNSPQQTVLSGATREVERAAESFKARDVRCKQLNVSAAFHSAFVSDAGGAFLDALKQVAIHPPQIPVYADSTGTLYPDDPDEIRELLAGQLANPVEFIAIVEHMYERGVRTFFEIGPSSQMSTLVKAILEGRQVEAFSLDSSKGKRSGEADLARALSQLSSLGYALTLSSWDEGSIARDDNESKSKKRKMTVALNGANYFKPKAAAPPVKRTVSAQIPENGSGARISNMSMKVNNTVVNSAAASKLYAASEPETQERPPAAQTVPTANPAAMPGVLDQSDRHGAVPEALRMTQENLRILQQFQQQTADLHRQFLEGQEAARQSFERLFLQQQQLLLGQTQPVQDASQPVMQPPAQMTAPTEAARPSEVETVLPQEEAQLATNRWAAPSRNEGHVPKETAVSVPQPVSEEKSRRPDLKKVLMAVVSEKTGYPEEMLDLDMGLDADLGIDSIKRVEILSALQEALPHSPEISSDQIGSIQSLRQIVELLGRSADVSTSELQSKNSGVESGDVERVLLEVVSEKTGYPEEMLDLDMGLDADLGIDSIKRVEILSALQSRLPDAPEIDSDQIGQIQNLRQIIDVLSGPVEKKTPDLDGSLAETAPVEVSEDPMLLLERSVPVPESLDRSSARRTIQLSQGSAICLIADPAELCHALQEGLQAKGFQLVQCAWDQVDSLCLPEELGALILLAPAVEKIRTDFPFQAFTVLQKAAGALTKNPSIFVTISRLDGQFAFGELDPAGCVFSGGLAGLTKTAAREWPGVNCKALDLAPSVGDPQRAAEAILEEVFLSGPVEVGISRQGRIMLKLQRLEFASSERRDPLHSGDLLLISGGARGVTAECAVSLAKTFQPTIALLGRSPLPDEPEAEWSASLSGEAEMKKAIIQHFGGKLSPKEADRAYQQLLSAREIRRNIARIEAAGSTVLYRSVDVRDAVAVHALLRELEQEYGAVRGLIHGAGVLADCTIEDKTPDQFGRVYGTKVQGLLNLLEALQDAPLKVFSVFSSTSARFGRIGQVDYAVANEVLNKLTQQYARKHPDCRAVAVNWGPWAGGMVTAAHEKIFKEEGIELIPLRAGAEYLLQELSLLPGKATPHEVLILGAGTDLGAAIVEAGGNKNTEETSLTVVFERIVDVETHSFLKSHVIGGRAVLPMAMTIEWMAHAALHGNPGLVLQGFNDLRILKGLVLAAGERVKIQVLAGETRKKEKSFLIPLELHSLSDDGTRIRCARAEFILGNRHLQGQGLIPDLALPPASFQDAEIYQTYLFHGPAFHGIQHVEGCSAQGIAASVKSAPGPWEWQAEPFRNHWLTEPLMMDSAFQLLILWSFEHRQAGSLPAFVGRYRQFMPQFPKDGGHIVAHIIQNEKKRALSNIEFRDSDGALIACIENYECTIDPSLNQTFQLKRLS
ncbi:hypothetical protein CSB45_12710 [candidate division KSB3 bacterium]|uniref:Beta-ketoacyl synthase n=1 Tax=candidate division KSB3 bacterium TaxID=2044937 RepID=A0A2G6E2G3_9BACT|nr:MAG: hypothetical protein CSB45_12710 [candidate division KSB3 bacterium]PIE28794.1 MAG: hypothetical protein CSA57_12235 [candidate division KSB3 bacterium]